MNINKPFICYHLPDDYIRKYACTYTMGEGIINLLTNIASMQVHIERESKSAIQICVYFAVCIYSTEVPSGLSPST